jgi:hypothetical protein
MPHYRFTFHTSWAPLLRGGVKGDQVAGLFASRTVKAQDYKAALKSAQDNVLAEITGKLSDMDGFYSPELELNDATEIGLFTYLFRRGSNRGFSLYSEPD